MDIFAINFILIYLQNQPLEPISRMDMFAIDSLLILSKKPTCGAHIADGQVIYRISNHFMTPQR